LLISAGGSNYRERFKLQGFTVVGNAWKMAFEVNEQESQINPFEHWADFFLVRLV